MSVFRSHYILPGLVVLVLLWLPVNESHAEAYSCHGRIPNPISDVAWKGIFPITIGGTTVASYGQIDTGQTPPMICQCSYPTFPWFRLGIGITFWEPARVAEAVTTPFCSPTLGGISLGSTGSLVKKGSAKTDSENRNSFYHVHWYAFPLTNWMTMLTDTVCVAAESFDLMMLSEFEPTWQDDELSTIFSPESSLFANLPAQAACGVDCVAASAGFGQQALFWCAGCQGSMYPLTGNVVNHESGIQASLLTTQRMHSKLHRASVSLEMNSVSSMCISHPIPLMNKQSYKTQMIYPIPVTWGTQPYGRSEALWSPNHEYPVKGEDFSYLIWRRRVCCAF